VTDDRNLPDVEHDKRELALALVQRVDTETTRFPDGRLGRVIERGRSLRRRRRSTLATLTAAALIATALAGPRIEEALQSSFRDDALPAGLTGEEARAAAATFAIRSLAHAGLMNPRDDFYSYRSTEADGSSWRVTFASNVCFRDPDEESCADVEPGEESFGNPRHDTHVDVGVDDGRWTVEAIEGPMRDHAREKVLSHEEIARPIAPHPEFAPAVLSEPEDPAAEGGGLEVTVASYWAGPIPERRIVFACQFVAFDGSGELIYEGHGRAYEAATSELERRGFTTSTALPPDVDAARVAVRCERFTGPGWELLEQPPIRSAAGGRAVHVGGEIVWRDELVAGLDLECTLRVVDAEGAVVGERRLPMESPWAPGDEPPLTRPLDAVVDADASPDLVPSAEFSCTVSEPLIRQTSDDEDREEEPGPDRPPGSPPTRPEDRPPPPDGPAHRLASGRFEGGEWGAYEGQIWALEVWSDDLYRCFGFGVGAELDDDHGRLCSYLPSEGSRAAIGGRSYIPGGVFDGELAIVYGEVRDDVVRVRVELSTGTGAEVATLVPPAELGIDARYFVAFVEPSEGHTIVALDDEGRVLDTTVERP
jgi:hypothetical protein